MSEKGWGGERNSGQRSDKGRDRDVTDRDVTDGTRSTGDVTDTAADTQDGRVHLGRAARLLRVPRVPCRPRPQQRRRHVTRQPRPR